MKCSLLRAVLFVGVLVALDDAAAIEIAIDDTKIELITPKGYCPLDQSSWPESQLIDFTPDGIKRQGERLAYFADCERVRSSPEGSGYPGFCFSHNVKTPEEVNAILQRAKELGGSVVLEPEDGPERRIGYIADPDGFQWEIAWTPKWHELTD